MQISTYQVPESNASTAHPTRHRGCDKCGLPMRKFAELKCQQCCYSFCTIHKENSIIKCNQCGQTMESHQLSLNPKNLVNRSFEHDDVVDDEIKVNDFHPFCQCTEDLSIISRAELSEKSLMKHSNSQARSFDHEYLLEMIDVLTRGIYVLNDDIQRLSSDLLRCQLSQRLLEEEVSKLKAVNEEKNSLIDFQNQSHLILEQSFISLQQQTSEQMNVSTDGTLLWKITGVHQHIADARNEQKSSIYSPAFYSSPHGYKMKLRLYLNGDGSARGTHMSLFFVLMRGEYDAILVFPFSHKITFGLIDQTTAQTHIIDSMRPDTRSSSFERPRTDMNIASGIPKFAPLNVVLGENSSYVRNDTMFIKAIVHFDEIPKSILSHFFNINHGLPTLTQRDLIKTEIEKNKSSNTN